MMGRSVKAMLAATAFCAASAGAAQDASLLPDNAAGTQAEAAFEPDASLGNGDLAAVAGRANIGTQVAAADQRNTVSNNSVTGNSTTGGVQIDGNAFQNLQGLAVINANSGNNVAINSAMNVTIHLGGPQ